MMNPLGAGERFPTLVIRPVDADPLQLPDAFAGR